MARPQKEGLDYFSIDVDMFTEQDDKTYMLYAKYGLDGIGIILKLLQRIYSDKGYYKAWGEREAFLFSKQITVDVNTVDNLVNDCINEGFFNKNMYDTYKILTSTGIQKRYFKACERRKSVEFEEKYLLVNPEKYKKQINADKNGINADINPFQGDNNPQSKVKESKVNIQEEGEQERVGKIFQFYQANIGVITQFQSEVIGQYLDEGMEPELIITIMQDSIGMDVPWSWIKKVLANSDKNNIKTLEQYEAKKAEKGRKKEEKGKGKPQNNKSTFNNFEGRGYDAKALEKWFLIRDRDDVTQEEKDKVYQELTNSSKGK
jgi:DnaD/phage-associated family protein